MGDRMKFLERILDQVADAVIFADRSGTVSGGTARRRRCSGSAPRRRWVKVSI